MALYNIVCSDEESKGDFPNYHEIGDSLFARLYLVSRNKEKAQKFAVDLSSENLEYKVEELSFEGSMRYYLERFVFGNLSFFLGDSFDLDSEYGAVVRYWDWCDYLKNNTPVRGA